MKPENIFTKYLDSFSEVARKPFGKVSRTGLVAFLCLSLVVVTLAVYMQVGSHEFLNFDDDTYVTNNPHVASGITGQNIIWAFTSVDVANWHPITWLSHMADVQIYGMNPRGHHLTNVAIHIVSALLLFFLLVRLTGALWQSVFVAALFALHPLHVESVAWIAERKDVLSAFFWLLTILAYQGYVANKSVARYGLVILLFALGLMAKPMLVTLPCVLLILDYWPLDRLSSPPGAASRPRPVWLLPFLEKIPLFLLSALSSGITYYAQQHSNTIGLMVPLKTRVMVSLVAYSSYLEKMFWPDKLAIIYPFTWEIPVWRVVTAVLMLVLITAFVFAKARQHSYLLVGWLWYLGTLVPVIGIVQIGLHSMADRYTYLPLIGIFIMLVWGSAALVEHWRLRPSITGTAAVAVLAALSLVSWNHLATWRNSVTLFSHAVQVTDNNYVAYYNLGVAYQEQQRYAEASNCYRQSLLINKLQPQAWNGIGVSLAAQGKFEEAIQEYGQAIKISKGFADAYTNQGQAFVKLGRYSEAIASYEESLRIRPDDTETLHRLGFALAEKGDLEGAITRFYQLLLLKPKDASVHYNLGVALMQRGNYASALNHFTAALAIAPDNRSSREKSEECRQRVRGR